MSLTYEERRKVKERFKKDFYSVKKRPFVDVPEEYKKKTEEFNKGYVDCKKAEIKKMKHNDNRQMYKRATTGRLAECAVELYLHKNFTDWTIGKSEDYNYTDLEPGGLPVGVKCSVFGNYPTFDPDTTEPQIICTRLSVGKEKKERIFILGLATPEILKKYSDINLILDDNLRAKKKPNGNYAKTAFYGFEHLIPFKTEKDIKEFIEKYKKKSLNGIWKTGEVTSGSGTRYFYLSEDDLANKKHQMSFFSHDKPEGTLYVATAHIGVDTVINCDFYAESDNEARKISEEWFMKSYEEHIEKLEKDLLCCREQMRRMIEKET